MKKISQKAKKKESQLDLIARNVAEIKNTMATKEDVLLLSKRLDVAKLQLETKIETAEMRLEGKILEVQEVVEVTGETETTDLQNRMVDAERNIRVLVKQFPR